MDPAAWTILGTIITALASTVATLAITLYKRVENENKELKLALKERDAATAIINATNAEMAAKYIRSKERS